MVFLIGELAGETLATRFGLAVVELPIKLRPVDSALVWHERTHRDPAQTRFRSLIMGALAPVAERYPPRRRSTALVSQKQLKNA